MLLSIIITHHKTPDLLKLCLDSAQAAGQGLEQEILVLDSEAEEETGAMITDKFPAIKYFPFKENTGYAKIVNIGVREARGQYVLVLNADMILEPASLTKMVNYMAVHPTVGVLGPQLLNFDGLTQESCFRFHRLSTVVYRRTLLGKTIWGKKELARFAMRDFDRSFIQDVDWVLGAALFMRRHALEQVGLMDERFFLYLEDTDWCRRFWEKKWQVVYFPDARMHHYHSRVSKKSSGLLDLFINKYTWIHIASAVKYFWKFRNQPLPTK